MSKRSTQLQTQVAEIRVHTEYTRKAIDEIKETVKDVPQIKADYADFRFWRNKIIVGVLVALLVSGILAIVRVAYGPGTRSGSQTSRSFHTRPQ